MTHSQQELAIEKISQLLTDPMPPGLRFEKLKGHRKPDIYTIHLNGNYKVSLQLKGDVAELRNVGNHNEIDRSP